MKVKKKRGKNICQFSAVNETFGTMDIQLTVPSARIHCRIVTLMLLFLNCIKEIIKMAEWVSTLISSKFYLIMKIVEEWFLRTDSQMKLHIAKVYLRISFKEIYVYYANICCKESN